MLFDCIIVFHFPCRNKSFHVMVIEVLPIIHSWSTSPIYDKDSLFNAMLIPSSDAHLLSIQQHLNSLLRVGDIVLW